MGRCEWVSDLRGSAWLANPCEMRNRIIDVRRLHHVGSAYGIAIRTIKKACGSLSDSRESVSFANPRELRITILAQRRLDLVMVCPV